MHGVCVWCVNLKKIGECNCSCLHVQFVYVCMYSVYLWVCVVCVCVACMYMCVYAVCFFVYVVYLGVYGLSMYGMWTQEVEGYVGCILTEAKNLKTDLGKGENVFRFNVDSQ